MSLTDYEEFIASKRIASKPSGFTIDRDTLHKALFEYQLDIVTWALRRGRAALFEHTGMGKTLQQLVWGDEVSKFTNGGMGLLLAPLAVTHQTKQEADRWGITAREVTNQSECGPGINITNYDKLDRFDPSLFDFVIIDESSRLKSYDGAFRNFVISAFANCPFRLACTATPAPNDYMELGNHAEFLGIMTRTEMLATFFTHDGGDTSKWILKGHAEEAFWKWVCTWAVMIQKPSDLGYSDDGFELPPLHIHHRTVERDDAIPDDGALFQLEARTLQERQRERKLSTTDRVGACAEIVLESDEQCIVWCDRNGEQDAIAKILGNRCVSIHGHGMSDDDKVRLYELWKSGAVPYMVVKGIMFGFGLNMQQCHRMVFLGLSDSWEQYFQAIRRCWRFGQAHAVDSYVVTSSLEGAVVANIERKEQQASEMAARMIEHMRAEMEREIRSCDREEEEYAPTMPMVIPSWLRTEVY